MVDIDKQCPSCNTKMERKTNTTYQCKKCKAECYFPDDNKVERRLKNNGK